MVVVIGIITMMTLLYTTNFKGFQQGLAVESDADKIASSLRQVQLWALTGELIGGSRPAGGYGLIVVSPCTTGICTYTVFGDLCNPAAHTYDSGCDTVVRTDNLSTLVSVTQVTPSNPFEAVFTFPTATPFVNGSAQNGSVTLTHRGDPAKTKKVSLDGVSGQITIQ